MPFPKISYRLFFLFCLQLLSSVGFANTTDTIIHDNDLLVVHQIDLIGNSVTRDAVLLRELAFKMGDTLHKSELSTLFKRSEDNLYNTRLFNSTEISWIEESGSLRIFVIVNERWYIFPIPILEVSERNFNAWWATKDYSRIIYGLAIDWRNVTGLNDYLTTTIRLGYTQRLSFNYSIPYIDKARKLGYSISGYYSRNHETNVMTVDDKQFNYKDEHRFVKKEESINTSLTYRPGLYESHIFEAGFRHTQVTDSVVKINNNYFMPGDSSQRYFSMRYLFKSNHVDITQFPTKGYYFDAEVDKNGLPFLGDNLNTFYLMGRAKYFIQLKNRWYAAAGSTFKISGLGQQPFYNTRGLGYNRDFIRGYEYYVIDGQNFVLFKSEVRFAVVPQKTWHAGFVPSNKFNVIPFAIYASIFMDNGYVSDKRFAKENPLTNSWQYGYGAGLSVFTTYDLILRMEYSFNKLGESGFFIHFTSPI